MKLNEMCCEAHKADWLGTPNLEEIVHYDAWARRWVADKVGVRGCVGGGGTGVCDCVCVFEWVGELVRNRGDPPVRGRTSCTMTSGRAAG